MNDDSPVFVISVAAELAGMHPQTLRQYDRLGLVTPGRSGGGGRRYSARDVALLREVQRLSQEEGVNLAGIKRVIELENQVEALQARLAETAPSSSRRGRRRRTRTSGRWRRCGATWCRCRRARWWSGSRALRRRPR
jgi:MerR family transcriptional regulator/heat shock protein HspR